MKRGRNQRRRPGGGNNPNRAHDSNGPDVRIRGTANQIYDKYVALARDASSSGDRVKAENYLQHAEHYFRVLRANQATQQAQQAQHAPSSHQANGEQPSVAGGGDKDDAAVASGGAPRANGRGRGRGRHQDAAAETGVDDAPPKEAPQETASADAGDDTVTEKKPARKRRVKRTPKADAETADAAGEEAPAAAE